MPEPYGSYGLAVPKGKGDVPSAPQVMKDYTDSLDEALTAASGKLLIAQPSDVAKFVAMKGDGTIDGEGNFQLGGGVVGTAELADGSGTEAKHADGAITSRKFKPTAGVVSASSGLTLGTSYQDVPGASLEITPAVGSILKVTAIFDMDITHPASESGFAEAIGTLSLDGADQPQTANVEVNTSSAIVGVRNTACQVYSLALTAAAHTIKMRAKRNSFGTGTCYGSTTRFLYELVAS